MRRLVLLCIIVAVAVSAWWLVRGKEVATPQGETVSLNRVLGGSAEGYTRADSPRWFSFPEDHGPHPGFRNEWWYFTGNLETAQGRRFGYQLTFFSAALAPHALERGSHWGTNEVIMAHFAVTDVDGKRFLFSERLSRAALGLAGAGGTPLTVWLEEWVLRQTNARPWGVTLSAAEEEMGIELQLSSSKPEVLNGEDGLSRKSATPGNASYYYSIPRLATSGTIRVGRETFTVAGLSWLDREWSTSALDPDQKGWDWFALHLDDGRDIMYYQLRKKDGSSDPFSSGTVVGADGKGSHLKREEVHLEPVGRWKSHKSGVSYPSGWRMRIPSHRIDLEITPRLADQELVTGFRYWEGAVAVKGSVGGSGYLEMTGYGD